ncbi:hypothetical protein FO519_006201 [Halicephalobus sp. NKZ332]|nr:hypothetical protein FO519_006201 [Halicephalobus sp. NKZ332]
MSVEELLQKEREGIRVLSIQSHVVSGHAGNKCSIFPLQLHGFEVDFINSVQFSNHGAYPYVRGQRLTEKELGELYEGLKLNSINRYSHVLTGYCGNPTFLAKIVEIVQDLRTVNKDLLFVCDPVLGDNGEYYTPKELMEIYRDKVLPIADVITPNAFELSELSGQTVSNQEECLAAISLLHQRNPNISVIVVTSGIFSDENTKMYCYASKKLASGEIQKIRFTIPVIKGTFGGTGDVFASLLIVWLTETNGDLRRSVSNVISSLQKLLNRTARVAYSKSEDPSAAERELKLINGRFDLLYPNESSVEFIEL